MSDQPIIEEETGPKIEDTDNNMKIESDEDPHEFVDEVKIGDKTIFTIPLTMKFEEADYIPRERKTRWGELIIRKQKVHEDVIFNPLEALISGNSLLPITQYGQSEMELKMSLYTDPAARRKSKWHHDIQKTFVPPMMNYISHEVSLDEVEYLIRLYRLDQLTSKMNDFAPEDPDVRSPSPQPIYDRTGKRVNTRQVRKRDSMVRQRVQIIEDCMKMRKTFVPPTDYKPLKKYKKIYLNDTAMNDTNANYMGRIIGRGGSTQRIIQERSGCKIAIRGRGANSAEKDIYENFDRLHVLITADTDQQLEKGVQEIQKILNGQEDQALKAAADNIVALSEGIFKENRCENCHEEGHRTWACPHQLSHTRNTIKCGICGEISHPTSDCSQKAEYIKNQQAMQQTMLLESQYSKFKEEMNESKKPKQAIGTAFITDINKKQLLAIEAGSVTAPNLGAFPIPAPKVPPALPKFADPKPPVFSNNPPNFNSSVPKFSQAKK